MPSARGQRLRRTGDADGMAKSTVLAIGETEEHALAAAQPLLEGACLRTEQRLCSFMRAVIFHPIGIDDIRVRAAMSAEMRPC